MSESVPTILIVDDEPSVRLTLRLAVERCGYGAVTASNSSEAMTAIRETEFQCVLLDKNLPDGNGLVLLEEIRREKPDASVLVVTGYVSSQSAIEALRLGAVDYLAKPLDLETIEHRLKAVLSRRAEKARLESLLVHADRLSSLGAMAAGIVHELNNPLSFVSANLSFLEGELTALASGAAEPVAARLMACLEATRDALGGAERVTRIVKDLRTFSRRDESAVEPILIQDCLEAALTLASPSLRGKARVERRYDARLAVRGNATRLEQVFLNLLVNAAQAIESKAAGPGLITLTSSDEGGQSVVEIADDGPGMPPAVSQRLFEPFFTTKGPLQGTGLGLSVCHGIVTGLGGSIGVRSEPGQGTVVRVSLPGLPPGAE